MKQQTSNYLEFLKHLWKLTKDDSGFKTWKNEIDSFNANVITPIDKNISAVLRDENWVIQHTVTKKWYWVVNKPVMTNAYYITQQLKTYGSRRMAAKLNSKSVNTLSDKHVNPTKMRKELTNAIDASTNIVINDGRSIKKYGTVKVILEQPPYTNGDSITQHAINTINDINNNIPNEKMSYTGSELETDTMTILNNYITDADKNEVSVDMLQKVHTVTNKYLPNIENLTILNNNPLDLDYNKTLIAEDNKNDENILNIIDRNNMLIITMKQIEKRNDIMRKLNNELLKKCAGDKINELITTNTLITQHNNSLKLIITDLQNSNTELAQKLINADFVLPKVLNDLHDTENTVFEIKTDANNLDRLLKEKSKKLDDTTTVLALLKSWKLFRFFKWSTKK